MPLDCPRYKQKGFAVIYLLIGVLILAALGGAYFIGKSQVKTPQSQDPAIAPQVQQTAQTQSPVQEVDETVYTEASRSANWRTYTNGKITFKYPSNVVVKENIKDFLVILANEETPPQNSLISIDARLENMFADYENAVKDASTNLLESKISNIDNGVKISGKVGPGFGEGLQVTQAFIRYKQGAIVIETTQTSTEMLQLFNQILSTFKFLP